MNKPPKTFLRKALHFGYVLIGAKALTLVFFLVLPLIQAISSSPKADTQLVQVDAANLPPPPPPPPEEEPEQEPEPEEPPPQLEPDVQPLDLSQLELALNPGFSDGWMGGDFAIDIGNVTGGGEDVDALFSLADLDQKPRAIYQPQPVIDRKVRKKTPGKVWMIFIVNQDGRVEKPIVQSSTDPVFERPALATVKKWKFEPGKRKGQPVSFRMKVPITFPKGQ